MSFKGYGVFAGQHKRGHLRNLTGFTAAVLGALCWPAISHAEERTILALGDSLTAGYGLNQGEGLVPQLEGWLREQGADVSVINAGVSGDTTAGGKARLGWSLSDDVDIVLVNLGGNDMLRGLPPTETHKNLDAILTELNKRALPSILVRVPGSLNFGPAEKKAYDDAFPALAQKHGSAFIPNFFGALEALNDNQTAMQTLMQPDGLHPTAEGVALIVEEIGPVILRATMNDLQEDSAQ
ncbi:arylesterase [Aliiroseovarius sp. KMU-50]|uniref:Arylesterase n=1 Tax=Aliiroseovarius salicola TaxID=3009082 RepID=A0ABT4W3U4_9RHOB|nr:arylesterase [Aliiroseovarius sp. KMU-50]MDA5095174.1 arylesterase [Aliiroseovarius sp. KMU-50]